MDGIRFKQPQNLTIKLQDIIAIERVGGDSMWLINKNNIHSLICYNTEIERDLQANLLYSAGEIENV